MTWAIKKTYTWKEDPEYGSEGWMPDWLKESNVVTDGRLFAHDMLEHFEDDEGGLFGELMAMGSILHIRAETGYFYSLYNPDASVHLSADLSMMLEKVFYGQQELPPARHIKKTYRLAEEGAESILQEAVAKARQSFVRDFRDSDCSGSIAEYADFADRNLALFVHVMRAGYRKARRRWANVWDRLGVFNRVTRRMNEIVKRMGGEYYGAKLEITIFPHTEEVRARQLIEDDYGRWVEAY